MRLLARTILSFFVLLFIFLLHIFFIYLLPFPLNRLNTIFMVLLFFLWWKEAGSSVWISFSLHLLLEFVSDLPFGITVFSGTMSMLAGYWLFTNFFTNRSWYGITLLLVVSLTLFRLSFLILLLLHGFVFDSSVAFGPIIRFVLWEVGITGIVFLFVSAGISRLFFHFRPERIR